MQLYYSSPLFLITLSLYTLAFDIPKKNSFTELNNSKIENFILNFDKKDHFKSGISILLENIKLKILNDEYLKTKFTGLKINGNFHSINLLSNLIEYEIYTADNPLKSYKFNDLLNSVKKLKSISLLYHFVDNVKKTNDFKSALDKFHSLVFKEPDHFLEILNKPNHEPFLQNDPSQSENSKGGASNKNELEDIDNGLDYDKLDYIVKSDMKRDFVDGNPNKLIQKENLNLELFLDRKNQATDKDNIKLSEQWRTITTLTEDLYVTHDDISSWNSVLGIEIFLASNGNPLMLGQFLWLEIVYKYYNKFFETEDRLLHTWGDILHAHSSLRINMINDICGIRNTNNKINIDLHKIYKNSKTIDMHCQMLILVVEQINYLEQIYQQHFQLKANNNAPSDNPEFPENDSEKSSFLESSSTKNEKSQSPKNDFYYIYPHRIFNTPFNENLYENAYTPIEPITLKAAIDSQFENVDSINDKTINIENDSIEPLDIVNNDHSDDKGATNLSNMDFKHFDLRGSSIYEHLLVDRPFSLVYNRSELNHLIADDARMFLSALYMFKDDPIYAMYYQERISIGFEGIYSSELTKNTEFYKSLLTNTKSCLKALSKHNAEEIAKKLRNGIEWRELPLILSSFDKTHRDYYYCKDYLGLAMFFYYKSLGYTNLDKTAFLITPNGKSPYETLFYNDSYLIRDAIMVDQNWKTVLLIMRFLTLPNGIESYYKMRKRNIKTVYQAIDSWSRPNAINSIINKYRMLYSPYPSTILEKSLSSKTLEKLVSSIKFIVHSNIFAILNRFTLKTDGKSLIEILDDFITVWTKFGYSKSKQEIDSINNNKNSKDKNDFGRKTKHTLYNWMNRNYIQLDNWNHQFGQIIKLTLKRFLDQPHIKHLLEMNQLEPELYTLPSEIQLALDSYRNLSAAKDIMMMVNMNNTKTYQVWYPIQVNYQNLISVMDDVIFVKQVMNKIFDDELLEISFRKLCIRMQYLFYNYIRHPCSNKVDEMSFFINPYYSTYNNTLRSTEFQTSMFSMQFVNVWSFLYQIGACIISNRNSISQIEKRFDSKFWINSIYDPKSLQSIQKLSLGDTYESNRLKFFFSNSRINIVKILKTGAMVWLTFASHLIGNIYEKVGFKKIGTSNIIFAPYHAHVVKNWDSLSENKPSMLQLNENNQHEDDDGLGDDSDGLGDGLEFLQGSAKDLKDIIDANTISDYDKYIMIKDINHHDKGKKMSMLKKMNVFRYLSWRKFKNKRFALGFLFLIGYSIFFLSYSFLHIIHIIFAIGVTSLIWSFYTNRISSPISYFKKYFHKLSNNKDTLAQKSPPTLL